MALRIWLQKNKKALRFAQKFDEQLQVCDTKRF